jgi:cytochrome c551/c552
MRSDSGKPSSIPIKIALALLQAMTLIFVITSVVFAVPPAQAPDGEALFTSKGCIACHTIGGGDLVGPDLSGVTKVRTEEWLTKWLTAPDQMLTSDPDAQALLAQYNNVPMPNLGLTSDEVAALIVYLGGGATTGGIQQPDSPQAMRRAARLISSAINASRTADRSVCPATAWQGSARWAVETSVPTLTTSGFVQSDAAFASFMGAPSTQTMGAIWANTPLTPQEQADLVRVPEQGNGHTTRAKRVVADRPAEPLRRGGVDRAGEFLLGQTPERRAQADDRTDVGDEEK